MQLCKCEQEQLLLLLQRTQEVPASLSVSRRSEPRGVRFDLKARWINLMPARRKRERVPIGTRLFAAASYLFRLRPPREGNDQWRRVGGARVTGKRLPFHWPAGGAREVRYYGNRKESRRGAGWEGEEIEGQSRDPGICTASTCRARWNMTQPRGSAGRTFFRSGYVPVARVAFSESATRDLERTPATRSIPVQSLSRRVGRKGVTFDCRPRRWTFARRVRKNA